MTLFSQPFLDEHMKSDVPIDSIRNVLKRTFGAFEVPGSQKYSEPWKNINQRTYTRSRYYRDGISFSALRLPSSDYSLVLVSVCLQLVPWLFKAKSRTLLFADNKVDALN